MLPSKLQNVLGIVYRFLMSKGVRILWIIFIVTTIVTISQNIGIISSRQMDNRALESYKEMNRAAKRLNATNKRLMLKEREEFERVWQSDSLDIEKLKKIHEIDTLKYYLDSLKRLR